MHAENKSFKAIWKELGFFMIGWLIFWALLYLTVPKTSIPAIGGTAIGLFFTIGIESYVVSLLFQKLPRLERYILGIGVTISANIVVLYWLNYLSIPLRASHLPLTIILILLGIGLNILIRQPWKKKTA